MRSRRIPAGVAIRARSPTSRPFARAQLSCSATSSPDRGLRPATVRESARLAASGLSPETFTCFDWSVEVAPSAPTSVKTLNTCPEASPTPGVERTFRNAECGSESEPLPDTTRSVRP